MASNAFSLATRTDYDLAGHVVGVTGSDGRTARTAYDALGRKHYAQDAWGRILEWQYSNGSDRASAHIGLDRVRVDYTWNFCGELLREDSGARTVDARGTQRAQHLAYDYDRLGRRTAVTDTSTPGLVKTGSTRYDAAGNVIGERTVEVTTGAQGETIRITQDNYLFWDSRNRLRGADDGRVKLRYGYDDVGNRTSVSARYINDSDRQLDYAYGYAFDAMNRVSVEQGLIDGQGKVAIAEGRGKQIAYDLAGRRLSETWYGDRATQATVHDGDIDRGYFSYTQYGTATGGTTTESYRYDAAGQLTAILRDGIVVQQRAYDVQGRSTAQGAAPALADTAVSDPGPWNDYNLYPRPLAEGDVAGGNDMLERLGYGAEQRLSTYVAGSRDLDRVSAWRGSAQPGTSERDWRYTTRHTYAQGNLTGTETRMSDRAVSWEEFGYRAIGDADRQVSRTSVVEKRSGTSWTAYDANGSVTGFSQQYADNPDNPNPTRRFLTDVAGHVLSTEHLAKDGTLAHREHFLVVQGEQLMRTADDALEKGYVNAAGQDDRLGASRPLSRGELANAPRAVAVQAKDTLTTIARNVWGDGGLWFRIAEANGLALGPADALDGPAGPGKGAVLVLPAPESIGAGSHFSTGTLRPYDPTEAIGDTQPNLPPPPKHKGGGCGGIGKVIVAVVTIVVSIFAPYAIPALEGAWGAMGAAALGSVAGQVTGNILGVQDGFSLKAVATAALSAGLTEGLSAELGINPVKAGETIGGLGNATANEMAKAALRSTVNQGVNVAFGLQERFDWRQVAASAVAAPLASSLGGMVDGQVGGGDLGKIVGGLAYGLTIQGVNRALTGSRITPEGVAGDAFSYAFGRYRAEAEAKEQQAAGRASVQEAGLLRAVTGAGADARLADVSGRQDRLVQWVETSSAAAQSQWNVDLMEAFGGARNLLAGGHMLLADAGSMSDVGRGGMGRIPTSMTITAARDGSGGERVLLGYGDDFAPGIADAVESAIEAGSQTDRATLARAMTQVAAHDSLGGVKGEVAGVGTAARADAHNLKAEIAALHETPGAALSGAFDAQGSPLTVAQYATHAGPIFNADGVRLGNDGLSISVTGSNANAGDMFGSDRPSDHRTEVGFDGWEYETDTSGQSGLKQFVAGLTGEELSVFDTKNGAYSAGQVARLAYDFSPLGIAHQYVSATANGRPFEAMLALGTLAVPGARMGQSGMRVESAVANTPSARMFSSSELMGVEPASNELLAAVARKRDVVIAQPGDLST